MDDDRPDRYDGLFRDHDPERPPSLDATVSGWDAPISRDRGFFLQADREGVTCEIFVELPRTEFLFRTSSGALREATHDDLAAGQRVRAWTEEPLVCPVSETTIAEVVELFALEIS